MSRKKPERLVDLVGVAQRFQHQPAVERLQRDHIFLPAHRELADADLVGGLERVAKHDIGLFRQIVRGDHIIRLLEVHRVDAVVVDELDEVERLAALELHALDLLGIEQDVMALRDLIALDDLVAVDRPDAGHDLFIFDPLAGGLVDLVELDLRHRSSSPSKARWGSTPGRGGFALSRSDAQPFIVSFAGRFNHCGGESFRVAHFRAFDEFGNIPAASGEIDDRRAANDALPRRPRARRGHGRAARCRSRRPAAARRRASAIDQSRESNCPPASVPVTPARPTQ